MEWQGATSFKVQEFSFYDHPDWFTLGNPVPFAVQIDPGHDTLRATVPLTVTVPFGTDLSDVTVSAKIVATIGV